MTETTPNPNLSELRRLAEGAMRRPPERSDGFTDWNGVAALEAFNRAMTPATILALLDMVESAPTRVTET